MAAASQAICPVPCQQPCCLTARAPPASRRRQVAAGEPLLLSYGRLSNDFLLMDYGFVVPRNPHDRVALRCELDLLNVSCSCPAWGSGWRTCAARSQLHACGCRGAVAI